MCGAAGCFQAIAVVTSMLALGQFIIRGSWEPNILASIYLPAAEFFPLRALILPHLLHENASGFPCTRDGFNRRSCSDDRVYELRAYVASEGKPGISAFRADPVWEAARTESKAAGLRACWSED
jgi:hypothetical protein